MFDLGLQWLLLIPVLFAYLAVAMWHNAGKMAGDEPVAEKTRRDPVTRSDRPAKQKSGLRIPGVAAST
jgi:hypothetical protein